MAYFAAFAYTMETCMGFIESLKGYLDFLPNAVDAGGQDAKPASLIEPDAEHNPKCLSASLTGAAPPLLQLDPKS